MLKVGVIGAGGNARGHVRRLLDTAGATVEGVYDIDRSHARDLAEMCGGETFESVSEVVERCDAVFVCSWTAAHAEAVRAAVESGRPVFCEKPLSTSLPEAEEITRLVQESGVVNQIGLALRWRSEFRTVRELMADPDNGRMLTVCLHTAMPGRSRVLTGWRADAGRAGGGVLLEVGFHDIDLLEWLVGPATSVAAHVQWSEYDAIDDAAALSMAFANGCVGSLSVAWHDADTTPPSRHLQVVFERARYLVDGTGLQAWGTDGLRQLPKPGSDVSAESAFLAAVRDGTQASPGFGDGLRVHQILDAAYRSATAGGAAMALDGHTAAASGAGRA